MSELETQEQANSYDRWLQREVQEAIDSKKPRVPHDQVMAQMWEAIERRIPKAPI
ncbi:hypothetical protein [Comamonas sp. SCN 65-56]|uniref:type II toxin-antitoxin system RelB family antitoxin n=1 Tax=Comamonas sp. SCN 65-56 TaxID=1660095 RepID=UPI0025BE0B5C|nr:hypothetical protein [Comamonas sp. SCN 65-56]